jgi:outer membrane murein-binding lipoprotein Lpp
MLVMNYINQSDIESSLGTEKSKPIIDALHNIAQVVKENQDVLNNQQIQIKAQQESFEKQQGVLDDQDAVIHAIKDSFEEYKKGDLDRKTEIKKDLLIELATKADIEILNGKIDSLDQKMNGKIDSLDQKMNGKIDSLEQKMNGKIDSLEQKMNGKIDSLDQKMNGKIDSLKHATKAELEVMNGKIGILQQEMHGEFKSIKLWMKMLLALALLTIACFSPTAQVLIKLLKF